MSPAQGELGFEDHEIVVDTAVTDHKEWSLHLSVFQLTYFLPSAGHLAGHNRKNATASGLHK